MMLAPEMNSIAQLCSARLLDCVIEGALVAFLAGCLLRMFRNQRAGTRFAIWFSALIAIAALPLAGGAAMHPSVANQPPSRWAITLPGSWAVYLFIGWALLASVGLLRVARGLGKLNRLRKYLAPLDSASFEDSIPQTGIRSGARRITLCVSDSIQVPTAIGLFKPTVVIPRWVLEELSSDEVRQIIVHEAAHLRRWDDWTNLAQQTIKALFFFHPAVWWVERKVSLEREMACDEAVLAETQNPRTYAECLAHLAEKTFLQRSLALAQAALGRVRHLSLRVERILDAKRPSPSKHGWKAAIGIVAGFAVTCGVGIFRAPNLVAFRDARPLRIAAGLEAGSPVATHMQPVTWNSRSPAARVIRTRAVQKRTLADTLPPAIPAAHKAEHHPTTRTPANSLQTPHSAALVHLTSAHTDRVAGSVTIQTVFIVIQEPATEISAQPVVFTAPMALNQSVYEIQMWQVIVLHPPASQISRKEI